MAHTKSLAAWLTERGMTLPELIDATGMDRRIVEAIAHGRYTPSPQQRERLAAALGLTPDDIQWGHTTAVEHMYGHGPQFGRSP
jgi:transcriptional regulator with XRE-family HTH domain